MNEKKNTEKIVEQLSMIKRKLRGERLKRELEKLPADDMLIYDIIDSLLDKATNKELEEIDYFAAGSLYYMLSSASISKVDRYSLFMGSIDCYKECKRNVSKALMSGILDELEKKWSRTKFSPFELVLLKEVGDYTILKASKCGLNRDRGFLYYKEDRFHERFDVPVNMLTEAGFFDKKADTINLLKEQLYQFTEGYDSKEREGFGPFDPFYKTIMGKEEKKMGTSISIVIQGEDQIKKEWIFYHFICMQNLEKAKTISPEEMEITFGSFSRLTLESMIMTIKEIKKSAINKVFIREGEDLIPISEYHHHKKRDLLSSNICRFSNEYRMLCEKLLSAGSRNNRELQKTGIIVDVYRKEDFKLYFSHLSKIAEYCGLSDDEPRVYHLRNAKLDTDGNESGKINFFVIHGEIDEVVQSGMLDKLKNNPKYNSAITIWLCKLPENVREREHAIRLISIPSYGLCKVVAPIKISSGEARHALMKTLHDKDGVVLDEMMDSACASDVTCGISDYEDAVNFIRFRFEGNSGKASGADVEHIVDEYESPVFQKPLLEIVDHCPVAEEIRMKYGSRVYKQLRRFIVTLLHNEIITHQFYTTLVLSGLPGTRKTTLVEYIARWTKEVGLTPNNDVHKAHGEEMVSQYIAESATKMRQYLEPGMKSAVIFIDEVYKLMNAGAGGSNSSVKDSICCAGIDALLSFMDNNCVTTSSSRGHILVMAGYKDKLKKMTGPDFNPGFASRIGMEIELTMPTGGEFAKEAERIMRNQKKPKYSEDAIKKLSYYLQLGTNGIVTSDFNYRVLNHLLTQMSVAAITEGNDYIDESHVDMIIEEYKSNHDSEQERVIGF